VSLERFRLAVAASERPESAFAFRSPQAGDRWRRHL
jgi:hypothetical protein